MSPPPTPAPLGRAEQRLWFLQRLRPDDPAYTIVTALDITGPLAPTALAHAVGVITRRHPALRSTYEVADGRLVRRTLPPGRTTLPVLALDGLPAEQRVATRDHLLHTLAGHAFDLAAEPPVRWLLLRLDVDRHVLVLGVHHIAFDGSSLDVVCAELEQLYAAARAGRPAALPHPGRLPGGDCLAAAAGSEAGVRWWAARLAGAPSRLVPLGPPPGPPVARPGVHNVRFGLGADRAAALTALGRRAGCTPFMTLLAVTAAALTRTSGREDLVIGTPVAQRDGRTAGPAVGLRLTILPLRIDTSGDPTVLELLRRVRDVTLDAFDHRDVPFERIVEAVATDRAIDHTPVFQVVVAHQRAPRPPQLVGVLTRVLPVDAVAPKYALTVIATEVGGDVEICVQVDRGAADLDTAQTFAASLDLLLAAAAQDPRRRAGGLPMIGGSPAAPVQPRPAAPPAVSPVAPRTPLERAIATQWCATLGVETVDASRSFFELGGTSLLLVELQGRLAASVAPLALADLIRFPTVARLAAHVAGERADGVVTGAVGRGERRRAALGRVRR